MVPKKCLSNLKGGTISGRLGKPQFLLMELGNQELQNVTNALLFISRIWFIKIFSISKCTCTSNIKRSDAQKTKDFDLITVADVFVKLATAVVNGSAFHSPCTSWPWTASLWWQWMVGRSTTGLPTPHSGAMDGTAQNHPLLRNLRIDLMVMATWHSECLIKCHHISSNLITSHQISLLLVTGQVAHPMASRSNWHSNLINQLLLGGAFGGSGKGPAAVPGLTEAQEILRASVLVRVAMPPSARRQGSMLGQWMMVDSW